MKWSLRPLLGLVFAVTVAATFSFKIMVSGVAGGDPLIRTNAGDTQKPARVFNATLLKFAAEDLAEDSLRHNVEQLADGNYRAPHYNRQRSFLSSGRYHVDIPARYAMDGRIQLRSPKFYNLWMEFRLYMQNWWRRRRFQPDVMSNMVNVLKTSKMGRNDKVLSSERKYKTCAVVGNSGILLKRDLGKVIDDHEFVIRLNNARTGGYERDVGSKTSLSFVNSNILHLCARRGGCFCHPYGENVPIMMYMCQMIHFLDYAVCNSSHKAPLMITDPQLDVLCARIVKYYSVKRFLEDTGKPLEAWASAHGGSSFHYSSGMQAVMLALGVCNKVSIFGFGKSDSAKHHYHTNQKTELDLHDYQAEYDLYRDLVERPEAIPFVSDKFKFPTVVMHR